MSPRDFTYWLQGYFELSDKFGKENQLNVIDFECIRKHIKIVRVNYPNDKFMNMLENAVELVWADTCSKDLLDNLRNIIDAQFEHVFDKEDKNQPQLQAIHNYDNNKTYRC
jgi:hypothetical protein